MVPYKGTLELDMQHRFGLVNEDGLGDLFGIFGNSEIRLGLNYVPIDRLQLGIGISSERLMWDFNIKYALLKQGRSGGSPLSVTYYGVMAADTRTDKDFLESLDRYSFFNQLMIARKISNAFSLQLSGNVSYFNFPEQILSEEKVIVERLKPLHLSMSISGRYKFTDGMGFIFNYDHPITDHAVEVLDPKANLSFGIEITTSGHAFQIFAGNYHSIVPQLNNTTNTNSIGDGDFGIGFNITKIW
jgi:hypothetical protein